MMSQGRSIRGRDERRTTKQRTNNSFFGAIFVVYGFLLIVDFGDKPRFLKGLALGLDTTGFGAVFVLLGAWIILKDGKGG
jgi:hypothetical protein